MSTPLGTAHPTFLDGVVDGGGIQKKPGSCKGGTSGTTGTTFFMKEDREGVIASIELEGIGGAGGSGGSARFQPPSAPPESHPAAPAFPPPGASPDTTALTVSILGRDVLALFGQVPPPAEPPPFIAAPTVRMVGSQRYIHAGQVEYRRRDRVLVWLDLWASNCAECGARFEFAVSQRAWKFQPNRRCDKHKQRGRRVQPA